MHGIRRRNSLRTHTPEFKLKRLEDAAVHNVILDGVLPHPQLLITAILIPIIHFHALLQHSITPTLHYSNTPLLQHSITPTLHFVRSAAGHGRRSLCRRRFQPQFYRGAPRQSSCIGTCRWRSRASSWFETGGRGSCAQTQGSFRNRCRSRPRPPS